MRGCDNKKGEALHRETVIRIDAIGPSQLQRGRIEGHRLGAFFHGNAFPVPVFWLVASPFTSSGFFLSRVGSTKWSLTTCASWARRDRRVWSPASKRLRSAVLAIIASWYASLASVKRCTCSMKAVADFVNLFIASAYIAQVGAGCALPTSAIFHIVSLIPHPPLPSRRKVAGRYRYPIRDGALSFFRNHWEGRRRITTNPESIAEARQTSIKVKQALLTVLIRLCSGNPAQVIKIAQIQGHQGSTVALSKMLFAVERVMGVNQRQIALSVLESLRGDLMYAHLNNGTRVLDVADLRQYIYEQMGRIRTNALLMDGLYGNDNGHGPEINKSNGHTEKAHP